MSALRRFFRRRPVRYREGIIHLNAKVSDGAFDLGVAKQKLDSPKIARAPVDQGSFGAS